MEPEDDKNVLKHLLFLETQASSLVEDAQAEADRRISEGENLCRSSYEEAYQAEVARLEAAYIKEIAAIREDYKKQLSAYKDTLLSCPVDRLAFSSLAEHLLFREG